jgi:hypothetical protein
MMTNWKAARGLWSLDYNCYLFLARASVEEVAAVMAEDTMTWERDVLGKSVIVERDAAFIFRLKTHPWSIVVSSPFARTPYDGDDGWAKKVSIRLEQPVISYGSSDTCCTIGYTLISGGEVVEELWAEPGELGDDEEDSDERDEVRFSSSRCAITADEIRDPCDFVKNFFVELDAFEPGIRFEYFFDFAGPEKGQPGLVQNPGHKIWASSGSTVRDVPPMERVDFMVFRPRNFSK